MDSYFDKLDKSLRLKNKQSEIIEKLKDKIFKKNNQKAKEFFKLKFENDFKNLKKILEKHSNKKELKKNELSYEFKNNRLFPILSATRIYTHMNDVMGHERVMNLIFKHKFPNFDASIKDWEEYNKKEKNYYLVFEDRGDWADDKEIIIPYRNLNSVKEFNLKDKEKAYDYFVSEIKSKIMLI
jgi:hypothetical protein